jgi:DNA-binding transcriptional MerR regulator
MNNEYFLSINEVSNMLELPAHTLRYWEKQFPVAIKPVSGAGGRRYYRAETVASLRSIKELLYNRGMTIAGVKKLIHSGALPSGADLAAADIFKSRMANIPKDTRAEIAAASTPDKSKLGAAIDNLRRALEILKNE